MYQVIMRSWGGIRRPYIDGFETFEDATSWCQDHNWELNDGGYIWDLEIEEVEFDGVPNDPDIAKDDEALEHEARAFYEHRYGVEHYDYPEDEPPWMR